MDIIDLEKYKKELWSKPAIRSQANVPVETNNNIESLKAFQDIADNLNNNLKMLNSYAKELHFMLKYPRLYKLRKKNNRIF